MRYASSRGRGRPSAGQGDLELGPHQRLGLAGGVLAIDVEHVAVEAHGAGRLGRLGIGRLRQHGGDPGADLVERLVVAATRRST